MGTAVFTVMNSTNPAFNTSFGAQPTPVVDNKRMVRGTLVFSASYATGGDTLVLNGAAGAPGLREITNLWVDSTYGLGNVSGMSITLAGTKTAPKILAWGTNFGEIANATDLSALASIPVMLIGS